MTATKFSDRVAKWLHSEKGQALVAEIEADEDEQVRTKHTELLDEKQELETEIAKCHADFERKIKDADSRVEKAENELKAARNARCAIRRIHEGICYPLERKHEAVKAELEKHVPAEIRQAIDELEREHQAVASTTIIDRVAVGKIEQSYPPVLESSSGRKAKVFSNKPSLDRRLDEIDYAVGSIRGLIFKPCENLAAEIKRIRAKISTGPIEVVEV
jgi:hypothetical protein